METLDLVWLIPALPLAGFVILLVAGRKLGEPFAGLLATAMIGGSFLASVAVFLGLVGEDEADRQHVQTLFEWIPAGGWQVDVGFLADPLSITMSLFITGVGTLIHLYSVGYMHGDENFSKFFVYLNLFAFSMLMLVLGDNLLLTFLGWEGVGACSYFLISFWFTDPVKASAGKKAFITNRIGDWGFMVAIFASFAALGSVQYTEILSVSSGQGAGGLAETTATLIAVCLFIGAIGKSAQFPLFVWLPDAMAGPTPVSALIHAATMVTSGVYLLTRVNPIIAEAASWVPPTIAWVGAFTAFFAATIAISQRDIKKVLAYSTVSQLGYMFLAIGTGAYVAAIFHMVTHAFFKALLFLGSGSVIHGMHEEQDMTRMGNLRKYMPITAATFIVGWLAIAGVPPFSGFFSKDEILLYAWAENPALWLVGLVTALLTAFYMSRQVFLVFFGDERFTIEAGHDPVSQDQIHEEPSTTDVHEGEEAEALSRPDTADAPQAHVLHDAPHESPWSMTVPLVVLAVLAAVGGVIQLPFTSEVHFLADWLHPVLGDNEAHVDVATATKVGLAVVAAIVALVGIGIAYAIYIRKVREPVEPQILADAWRYDSTIAAFMDKPGRAAFEGTATFDRTVVDGGVNGVGAVVRRAGRALQPAQSGFVRSYALGIAGGAVVLLAYFIAQVTF